MLLAATRLVLVARRVQKTSAELIIRAEVTRQLPPAAYEADGQRNLVFMV
jgi:hypothetical protein